MKKIVGLLVFLTVVFIGDRVGGVVLGKLLTKCDFRYVRMYTKKSKGDIMIMGNSRGVNGFFQPYLEKQLEEPFSNISFNGMKTELAIALMEDYIDLYDPKIILVEGSMLFKVPMDPKQLNDFKIYAHYSQRLNDLLKREQPRVYASTRLFHLSTYNTNFYFRNLFYLNKSDKSWINNFNISDRILQETLKMDPEEIKVNPKALKLFKTFVESAEKKGIQIKIVIAPYLPAYREKMLGYESAISMMARELNTEVLNYSLALSETKHFADRMHNNKAGAIEFAEILIKDKIFERK